MQDQNILNNMLLRIILSRLLGIPLLLPGVIVLDLELFNHNCNHIYVKRSDSCLYILDLFALHPHTQLHTGCFSWLGHSSMSLPSPTSPLSFNNNSDGSSNLQGTIFFDNPPIQSPVTPMLDGGRPDHSGNPYQTHHSCYFDAVKFGVGIHGGNHQCPTQPESSAQLRTSSSPKIISIGEASTPGPKTIPFPPQIKAMPSTEELIACCLLGKIWGEPVPIPAIIHHTRNEWKFVKGQIEFIDLGNDWLLIRFGNSHDKMLAFDLRPWFVGLSFVVIC